MSIRFISSGQPWNQGFFMLVVCCMLKVFVCVCVCVCLCVCASVCIHTRWCTSVLTCWSLQQTAKSLRASQPSSTSRLPLKAEERNAA